MTVSDGREEREEEEKRREREKRRDPEDWIDRDLKDQWERSGMILSSDSCSPPMLFGTSQLAVIRPPRTGR